jgi:omega-hydroxy-beta-dihydromenaquinone-9 sulfotransferase
VQNTRTSSPVGTGGPHIPLPAPGAPPRSDAPAKPREKAAWKDAFFQALSPGVVTGIRFGDWVRLLVENRFRIHPAYWPRAGFTTLASLLTSAFHVAEKRLYGKRVAATDIPPPIFVLGHWRSGTTHLHNLLAIDDRFGSPRFSEVTIPWTFLTGEKVLTSAASILLPKTRFGIDNVSLSTNTPAEEEFALAQMTFRSPYMSWAFPRHADVYDRYVTFRGVPEREVREWQSAFVTFLKKLTLRHGKPMILKSPPNTGRIRLLLEIFPDARFVHIHRDPYTVYQSTRHLHVASWKTFAFQKLDEADLERRILRDYTEMFDAFFADRALIPAGRFAEMSFDELEADPVGQVERIYRELSLPDFEDVRPHVEDYVASLAGYRKNKHREIPAALRERIATEWRRSFDAWGYDL